MHDIYASSTSIIILETKGRLNGRDKQPEGIVGSLMGENNLYLVFLDVTETIGPEAQPLTLYIPFLTEKEPLSDDFSLTNGDPFTYLV